MQALSQVSGVATKGSAQPILNSDGTFRDSVTPEELQADIEFMKEEFKIN